MDLSDVETLIEDEIPDSDATVTKMRGDHDEDHLQAVVVSPAFKGERLVQQHERVYDALDGVMTTDVHALELSTFTPEEYEERER